VCDLDGTGPEFFTAPRSKAFYLEFVSENTKTRGVFVRHTTMALPFTLKKGIFLRQKKNYGNSNIIFRRILSKKPKFLQDIITL
jgi:hypothetical protein